MQQAKEKDGGVTFIDEKWRSQTIYPQRLFGNGTDGVLRPARAAPCWPEPLPPRTIAQKAAAEDLELWASCSSLEEYEVRKRVLHEHASTLRKAFLESQPNFHLFPDLPLELRNMVWAMAMEEATDVRIACSGSVMFVEEGPPETYAATATMPPFFLVNREAYNAASKHYHRVFRGVRGGGGVLGAYPIILRFDVSIIHLLKTNDFDIVREVVLDLQWHTDLWGGIREKVFKKILATKSLKKLDLRYQIRLGDKIYQLVRWVRSMGNRIRKGTPDWVAPEITIYGKDDVVVWSYGGGLLEFPVPEKN